MPDGMFTINFQGFACRAVSFRNSHGLEPDASMVEIFIEDFGTIQLVEGKAPGRPIPLDISDQPNVLYTEGDLEVKVVVDGIERSRKQSSLFVDSISKDNSLEPTGTFIVSLLDVRHLFDRGYLTRWRFNTLPSEPPASLYEIVESVVADLPGVTFSGIAPESWKTFKPPYEFDEMGRPREAMRKILNDYDAVFCLNEDNSVSIYLEGEESQGNIIPPESLIEHDNGRGHSVGANVTYRPQGALIVGGDRIGTVRINNWEPVLCIDGIYVPLLDGIIEMSSGATAAIQAAQAVQEFKDRVTFAQALAKADEIRKQALEALSDKRFEDYVRLKQEAASLLETYLDGAPKYKTALSDSDKEKILKRVRRFLVMPDTWRKLNGFTQEAMDIIRRDAYRLFRLPGADSYNSELLPILDRAETDTSGRRLRPLVRCHGWERVNSTFLGFEDPRSVEANVIANQLITIRNLLFADPSLKTTAGIAGNDSIQVLPGGQIEITTADGNTVVVDTLEFQDTPELRLRDNLARKAATLLGVANTSGVFNGFQSGRVTSQANLTGNTALAEEYARQVDAYHKLQLALNPLYTGDLEERLSRVLYQAAEVIFNELTALEAAGEGEGFVAQFNVFGGSESVQQQRLLALLRAQSREVEEIQRLIAQRQRGEGGDAGERDLAKPNEVYYFVNYNQQLIDRESTVEDAASGVIRTSQVAMQLVSEVSDAASLAAVGELAPGPGPDQSWPVSVEFGARIVPKFRTRPTTGSANDDPEDIIPPQMSVALNSGKPGLGTFLALYARNSDGSVSKVNEGTVPNDRIVSVPMPNLVELISLTGITNEDRLLESAKGAAISRLNVPGFSTNSRTTYLHPHGTRCDGVVSAVDIRSRRGMLGIQTVVVKGRTERPFDYGNKTTTRRNKLDEMRPARPLPTGRNFID